MQGAYGYFSLFGIYIVLIIFWALALIWIWQDADETYGYGWFWALLMILLPGITIIIYLITKRTTHRTQSEDLQAWENRQSRHGWGWSSQQEGQATDLTKPCGRATKFKPFNPGFNDSVEDYMDRKHGSSKHDDNWYRK